MTTELRIFGAAARALLRRPVAASEIPFTRKRGTAIRYAQLFCGAAPTDAGADGDAEVGN